VGDVESLTAIEFETREMREARLDDKPLSQRVHDADERDADSDDEPEEEMEEVQPFNGNLPVPERIPLTATGPHALLQDVHTLGLETDYPPDEWSLRMPYDNFVLTLARDANVEGALFEQRLGAGRILLAAGGTLFTNRALGNDDNARLIANIVAARCSAAVWCVRRSAPVSRRVTIRHGFTGIRALQDDLHRARTVADLGHGRNAAACSGDRASRSSEAELVRSAGRLIARTVAPWQQALRLFDQFFTGVARAARGANSLLGSERGELWHWLERHAAILPQELDQIKAWYADAHAMRKLPLVPLQNLLDNLERRIKT
jgi:hypothetical protein